MVLIAVPMGQKFICIFEVFQCRDPQTVVTDMDQQSVIRDITALCEIPPDWFVPGHPIAGGEQNGVDAADADLYVTASHLDPTCESKHGCG